MPVRVAWLENEIHLIVTADAYPLPGSFDLLRLCVPLDWLVGW